MADKKDPGKFTVRFNIHDPQHQTVVALLNQQGRNKSKFLASAVLHYINCKETPEVTLPPVPDAAEIEKIVLAILKKHTSEDYTHPMPPRQEVSSKEPTCLPQEMPAAAEHEDTTDELKALLGDGGFSAIANTLASFGRT